MGALRVMSYTFDILRAGKQNCARSLKFALSLSPDETEFLAHRANLLSGSVRQSLPLYIFPRHQPQSLRAKRRRLRKLDWFVLYVGALCGRLKGRQHFLPIHNIAIATYHHLHQAWWASSLHSALEFQLKLDAVAPQLPEPIYTMGTSSSA